MRISDWSSDVCSSDLGRVQLGVARQDGELHQRQVRGVTGGMSAATATRPCRNERAGSTVNARAIALRPSSIGNAMPRRSDRTSVGSGKSVSVRVGLGGSSSIQKKKLHTET